VTPPIHFLSTQAERQAVRIKEEAHLMSSDKRWELLQLPQSGLNAFSILIDNILLDGLRCP
jgi:hypothetical protein